MLALLDSVKMAQCLDRRGDQGLEGAEELFVMVVRRK